MLKLTAETFIDLREEEEEFMKQLEAIHNGYVEIGVLGDAGNAKDHDDKDSGVPLWKVASVHEYGSADGKIPQRSFIGSTMDEQDSKFNDTTNKLLTKITQREMKAGVALKILGTLIKSEIKKKIYSNIAPELKLATIKRKNAGPIKKAQQKLNSLKGKAPLTEAQSKQQSESENIVSTGGKSTALIDTSQLVNSIDYKVELENVEGHGQSRVGLEDVDHD